MGKKKLIPVFAAVLRGNKDQTFDILLVKKANKPF